MTLHRMFGVTSVTGFVTTAALYTAVAGIMFSLFTAVHAGGGHVVKGWRPAKKEDEKNLQWCKICEGFKPPRSHHCQTCGRCVSKMDHHCPWINSCVGNHNHFAFLCFVTLVPITTGCYVVLGPIFAMENFGSMRHVRYIARANPAAFKEIMFMFVGWALSLAIMIAVGMLAIFQWKGVFKNQTQIEEWIVSKAIKRRKREDCDDPPFVFPYDLGSIKANVREVIWQSYYGDGVSFNVAEGCSETSFTEEQLAQKQGKRQHTRGVDIVAASDRVRGLSFGWRVWWSSPWCGEPRVSVKPGDVFTVWGWGTHWMYGEKVTLQDGEWKMTKPRQRGWFPTHCAVWKDLEDEGKDEGEEEDEGSEEDGDGSETGYGADPAQQGDEESTADKKTK